MSIFNTYIKVKVKLIIFVIDQSRIIFTYFFKIIYPMLCIVLYRCHDVFELLVKDYWLLLSDEAEEQRGGQEQSFQEEGSRDRDFRSKTQVGGDLCTAEEGNQTHTSRESVINSVYRSVTIFYIIHT